jgi:hypothetical protein
VKTVKRSRLGRAGGTQLVLGDGVDELDRPRLLPVPVDQLGCWHVPVRRRRTHDGQGPSCRSRARRVGPASSGSAGRRSGAAGPAWASRRGRTPPPCSGRSRRGGPRRRSPPRRGRRHRPRARGRSCRRLGTEARSAHLVGLRIPEKSLTYDISAGSGRVGVAAGKRLSTNSTVFQQAPSCGRGSVIRHLFSGRIRISSVLICPV